MLNRGGSSGRTIELLEDDLERLGQADDSPPTVRIGDVVDGRYVVKRLIAQGGMGAVFEAEHRASQRMVALKVTVRNDITEHLEQRLLLEGRALSMVDHPGVLRLFDMGVDPNVGPFLVTEMLVGRPLDGLIATRRRFSIGSVLLIGHELCMALAAVHTQKIVHRDVKPGNVFIAKNSLGDEHVRLIDFGIARFINAETAKSVTSTPLTGMGQWLGTVEYMPPEQFISSEVDHTADLYAAGMTLYECLAGRLPFDGDPMQMAAAASCGTPPVPLKHFNPDVSPELENIILRAISRDRSARFADARSMGKAFQTLARPTAPVAESAGNPPVKRKYERAVYVTPIRIARGQGRMRVDGRSEDLSEGGMLVIAPEGLLPGEPVTVRFSLPSNGRVVGVSAIARWSRGDTPRVAIGIEFTELETHIRDEIAHFVRLMGPVQ